MTTLQLFLFATVPAWALLQFYIWRTPTYDNKYLTVDRFAMNLLYILVVGVLLWFSSYDL
jgi:hypothetical protein